MSVKLKDKCTFVYSKDSETGNVIAAPQIIDKSVRPSKAYDLSDVEGFILSLLLMGVSVSLIREIVASRFAISPTAADAQIQTLLEELGDLLVIDGIPRPAPTKPSRPFRGVAMDFSVAANPIIGPGQVKYP